MLFQKYHNKIIREKRDLNYNFNENFIEFVKLEKTPKSPTIIQNILDFIIKNQDVIILIINIIIQLAKLKKTLSSTLDEFTTFKSYVELKTGEIKHINQEGFAISTPNGEIIKLVDREEFSYLNFSSDVIKGWTN